MLSVASRSTCRTDDGGSGAGDGEEVLSEKLLVIMTSACRPSLLKGDHWSGSVDILSFTGRISVDGGGRIRQGPSTIACSTQSYFFLKVVVMFRKKKKRERYGHSVE